MFITSGPENSGKTTTFYAIMTYLVSNFPDRKYITLENPVEVLLDEVIQIPIEPNIEDATDTEAEKRAWLEGLKTCLRMDMDVIMFGEVRGRDELDVLIEASLSGKNVLATFHANDLLTVFERTQHMGVEMFQFCDSIVGVMNQRLVRRVCTTCSDVLPPEQATQIMEGLGYSGPVTVVRHRNLAKQKECPACRGRGATGVVPVIEVLAVNPEIRALLKSAARDTTGMNGFSSLRPQLRELAGKNNGHFFEQRTAALSYIAQGVIAIDETAMGGSLYDLFI
jgi:type II secretory ATPase GspE/PulE/Tfp pilus assembly ATPase PilB-like protein